MITIKYKKNYLQALETAWPAVLESFFIALAGIIDTMMVGSLGSFAIAAVGLTIQPKMIAYTFFFAINITLSSLIARRRGQNDRQGANEVFKTALYMAILLCIATTILMLSFDHQLMRLAGSNLETHAAAVDYFQVIIGGMIFYVIAIVINASQRGSGNTRIAFYSNLASSLVNVCFNYLLIYGNWGFPALGIQGAAIATVIGTFVGMMLSIYSILSTRSFVNIKFILEKKIKASLKAVKMIIKLGMTLVIENIAIRIGFLVTAISAAKLGTNEFAIYNAGMTLLSLGFSFGDGMQVAAVALAGRALGQNKTKEALLVGKVCQHIGFMMSVLLSLFLFTFGRQIMEFYFTDAAVIEIATLATRFIMVIVLFQISQLVYNGCLRAGGDVKYSLFVGITSVSIIRSLVTLVTVSLLGWGLSGIWIGILADQLSRFTLLRLRFKSERWTQIAI